VKNNLDGSRTDSIRCRKPQQKNDSNRGPPIEDITMELQNIKLLEFVGVCGRK